MPVETQPQPHTGFEIAARLVKVVLFFGTIISWIAVAFGAYSVYLLWTTERTGETVSGNVYSRLELGWIAIGIVVLVRLVQIAIGWAVLAPLEAKIQGINLRDPKVASELRTSSLVRLGIEGVTIVFYVVVPLLIAHFRFGAFR
jgi:hypothetical protein